MKRLKDIPTLVSASDDAKVVIVADQCHIVMRIGEVAEELNRAIGRTVIDHDKMKVLRIRVQISEKSLCDIEPIVVENDDCGVWVRLRSMNIASTSKKMLHLRDVSSL